MKTPDEIEKLSQKYSDKYIVDKPFIKDMFIDVYTQFQKDNEEKVFKLVSEITTLNEEIDTLKSNSDKGFTLEDVINALHQAELKHKKNYTEIYELMKTYLQSLNK
jgi:succinyl-CoA synthetase alpha subunit